MSSRIRVSLHAALAGGQDSEMTENSKSRSPEAERREARRAAALRENLRRRKAQARARSQPAAADPAPDTAPSSAAERGEASGPGENDVGTGVSPQSGGE
jgi:hypothetical protein